MLPERKGLGFLLRKRRAKARAVTVRRLPGEWCWRRDGNDVEVAAVIAGGAAAVAKAIASGFRLC